jgi:virulence-associated protein VapD
MHIARLPRSRTSRAMSAANADFQIGNTERVYAISFDLNLASLAQAYAGSHQSVYDTICRTLGEYDFQRRQQGLYFGKKGSAAIRCLLAVQDLEKRDPWLPAAVSDIRMMRIEELIDLYPALGEPELPLEQIG